MKKITNSKNKKSNIGSVDLLDVKKAPFVSVIITTYNDRKHVCKAINSVLVQNLENIEVIVVDDASTDDTQKVLLQNYKNNKKVRLFFQNKNKKQGYQRNFGIKKAIGKYIFFLDSDDWLSVGAIIHLLSIAEKYSSEITACGANTISEKGKVSFYHGNDIVCKNKFQALKLFADYKIGSVIWNKLYLRSFIINNKLYFNEIYWHEDILFSRDAIYKCNNYVSISNPYYNYLIRKNSNMRVRQDETYIRSYINLYRDFCNFFQYNNIGGSSAEKILKHKLLKAHCFNNIYPNLIRYAKSRSSQEWKSDLINSCTSEINKYDDAIAEFVYSIISLILNNTNQMKQNHSINNKKIIFTKTELKIIEFSRKIKHLIIPSNSLRSKFFIKLKGFIA